MQWWLYLVANRVFLYCPQLQWCLCYCWHDWLVNSFFDISLQAEERKKIEMSRTDHWISDVRAEYTSHCWSELFLLYILLVLNVFVIGTYTWMCGKGSPLWRHLQVSSINLQIAVISIGWLQENIKTTTNKLLGASMEVRREKKKKKDDLVLNNMNND